ERAAGGASGDDLMPSTSMAVDFVSEGGRGTMSSISRSRLRALAIEIWRFDFDNFQAFIDRRNSSARKLIMCLTQELAIPRRAGLEVSLYVGENGIIWKIHRNGSIFDVLEHFRHRCRPK